MDEQEFRKAFLKNSVFNKASSLDLSYIPEKVYCRNDIIKDLYFTYRRIIGEKEPPSINSLLLGEAGVGKTLIIRYFAKKFR